MGGTKVAERQELRSWNGVTLSLKVVDQNVGDEWWTWISELNQKQPDFECPDFESMNFFMFYISYKAAQCFWETISKI